MRVIIIRHFKVQHTWKRCCTSVEFDEECRLYDKAPIERTKNKEIYDVKNVYISNLDRSLQTAKALFGDMDYCRTELIGEVPLRSAFDTKYRFPLWFWNVAGRMQWLFGCKRQPESRNGTKERALRFVHELTLRDDDCAIVQPSW